MADSIRPYVPADIDAVIDVWYRASQLAHAFLGEAFFALERERIRSTYMPNAQTYVYEHDGAVVGFIALLDHEVGALFVAPDHHGKGFGKALMDKARELRDTLELNVFEANSIGRAFYERDGFERVGRGEHEETGQTMLRMRWSAAR